MPQTLSWFLYVRLSFGNQTWLDNPLFIDMFWEYELKIGDFQFRFSFAMFKNQRIYKVYQMLSVSSHIGNHIIIYNWYGYNHVIHYPSVITIDSIDSWDVHHSQEVMAGLWYCYSHIVNQHLERESTTCSTSGPRWCCVWWREPRTDFARYVDVG